MKKIVFSFHDNWNGSRINKALSEPLTNVIYVDKDFNVEEHQSLLQRYEHIVLQYPVQWFYGPTVLKEWLDKVLSYGFAYGGQYALEGKKIDFAITLGGLEEAYQEQGANGVTVEGILQPMFATARYIKAIPGDVFAVHNVFGLNDEALSYEIQRYHQWIQQ